MNIKITNMIYDFYLIKGHIHYHENTNVIDSYNTEPGLINIAQKNKIPIVQVYDIMREYRLNQLNKNIILAIRGNI
tara:strand:+ start:91 stop:318 length:228 start_codon:yes stop_codon:yes gene_type:complete